MMRSSLLLLVVTLFLSSSVSAVHISPRSHAQLVKIKSELATLEDDLAALQRQRQGTEAFVQVGGDNGEENDLVLKDYNQFKSGSVTGVPDLRASLYDPSKSDFYRGAKIENGQAVPMLVVITKRSNSISGYSSFSVRIWKGNDITFSDSCFPADNNKVLRCTTNKGQYQFEPASMHGLLVSEPNMHHSARPMFWRYEEFGQFTDIKRAIATSAEFINFYQSECGKQVGSDEGIITGYDLAAVRRRFDSGRIGLEANLRAYRRQSALNNEDNKMLDALVNAVADQFKVTSTWAVKIESVWNDPNTRVLPAFTLESSKRVFTDLPEIQQLKSARVTKLNDQSAKYLKQGSEAGGKALSDVLGKQIKNYAASQPRGTIDQDTSLSLNALIQQIDSGEFGRVISGQLFDAVGSSDTLVNGLNGATDFVDSVQNTLAAKGKEIGDYFSRLLSFNKKKTAVLQSVNNEIGARGSLAPGEDGIAKTLFNTAAEADAENLKKREEALQIKNKFRFSPKVGMPTSGGGVLSAIKEINAGWRLDIKKGADSALFDINVRVKNPLDKKNAEATVTAKVEGQHETANGVVRAGVQAEGTVLGLYQNPQLQGLIVSSFITYNSKDGRLSTGFFATVNVPLTDAANAATRFHEGTEISLRGQLTWTPDASTKFTAYAQFDASMGGSFAYSAGARFEKKFSDNGSFFIDAGVRGGGAGGGFERPDASISIGLQFRF